MGKEVLAFLIGIFFIGLASAAQFSISEVFDAVDGETFLLAALFLIFFAFIYFALSKVFVDKYKEPNKGVAGIISLCVSLLIVYGIYSTSWDVEDALYGLGISETLLWIIVPVVLIAGAIFLIFRIGLANTLGILGALFFVLGLTDIVYEKAFVLFLGAACVVLFVLLKIFVKKRPKQDRKIAERVRAKTLRPSTALLLLGIFSLLLFFFAFPDMSTLLIIGLAALGLFILIKFVLKKREKDYNPESPLD